jgi:hypothetical protein
MSRRRSPKRDARQGWTSVEKKLIRLALDDAAAPGEVSNCAVKLFTLLRKRKVTAEQLIEPQSNVVIVAPLESGNLRLPFGKYAGIRISEVDPDYLHWFATNCQPRASKTCAAIARYLRQAGY